jgi:hypothetical protein
MTFEYFIGPEEDMSDYAGIQACVLCHSVAPAFELDSGFSAELSEDENIGKFGCVECLHGGRFEFWHDTEVGLLDEVGLRQVYSHSRLPEEGFRPEALHALRRTPRIVTWQQELWLTHCLDFMVYLGTWAPKDFYVNAPGGDARGLFLQMTSHGAQLWDQAGTTSETEWYVTYYAFRCRHCGVLRGNWDCG